MVAGSSIIHQCESYDQKVQTYEPTDSSLHVCTEESTGDAVPIPIPTLSSPPPSSSIRFPIAQVFLLLWVLRRTPISYLSSQYPVSEERRSHVHRSKDMDPSLPRLQSQACTNTVSGASMHA